MSDIKRPKVQTTKAINQTDVRSLMLCIAGAWLYGTISRGRAVELAKALGHTAKDIEDLKFVEERNREEEYASPRGAMDVDQ